MEFVNLEEDVDFKNRRDAYNFDNVEIGAEDVIFIRNLMSTNEGR